PVHAVLTLTSRRQSGKGLPAAIDKSLRALHQLLPHNLAADRLIDMSRSQLITKEKQMSNKRLAIVTVLSLAALLAVAVGARTARVYAQGDHMGFGGPGGDHMLGFLTDALDLTDQQQQQVKTILTNEKTTVQPLMQQLRDAHQQIQAATDAGNLT